MSELEELYDDQRQPGASTVTRADDGVPTEAQCAHLGELLRQRRAEVQQELAASREGARPVGLDLPIGRLTRVDALQQQQMAAARRQRLKVQLAQIQQALGRLQTGTYGECVRCEEPLSYSRLQVLPESPFCQRCQGKA